MLLLRRVQPDGAAALAPPTSKSYQSRVALARPRSADDSLLRTAHPRWAPCVRYDYLKTVYHSDVPLSLDLQTFGFFYLHLLPARQCAVKFETRPPCEQATCDRWLQREVPSSERLRQHHLDWEVKWRNFRDSPRHTALQTYLAPRATSKRMHSFELLGSDMSTGARAVLAGGGRVALSRDDAGPPPARAQRAAAVVRGFASQPRHLSWRLR